MVSSLVNQVKILTPPPPPPPLSLTHTHTLWVSVSQDVPLRSISIIIHTSTSFTFSDSKLLSSLDPPGLAAPYNASLDVPYPPSPNYPGHLGRVGSALTV